MRPVWLFIVLAGLFVPPAAMAADPRHPDWPCVQAKVPEISPAAIWAGPPIDDVREKWKSDPLIGELVRRIAARRTPLDQAEKTIADLLTGSPEEKQEKARLLFAGVFDVLNTQRTEVMNGIERFARRRLELAERIRSDILSLRTQQNAAEQDQGKINELTNQIEWQTRIFEDRRRTITYVCEVPVLIEQRLFALARAIQRAIE
jgi:hypothetical protein